MEKLMKPSEYAKELGISRQAVYAKIKRGILTAKDVEGKLYIVVPENQQSTGRQQSAPAVKAEGNLTVTSLPKEPASRVDFVKLLEAKDETIGVLKTTITDLKESNRQMSDTLKGEIDLLKSAFSEMRSLYVQRLEQLKEKEEEQLIENDEKVIEAEVKTHQKQAKSLEEWIGAKKFLKLQDIRGEKETEKALKRLNKAYKRGDERLNKVDGKLKIDKSQSFDDLLS